MHNKILHLESNYCKLRPKTSEIPTKTLRQTLHKKNAEYKKTARFIL